MKKNNRVLMISLAIALAGLPYFVAILPSFSGSIRSKFGPIEIEMEKQVSPPPTIGCP